MELAVKHPARASTRSMGALILNGAVVGGLLAAVFVLAAAIAPRLFGYRTIALMSGSMAPTAPTGSLVLARSKPAEEVAVGDVIVIRRQTGGQTRPPVLHRVVARKETKDQIVVETKGDANRTVDPEPYTLPPRVLTEQHVLPLLGYLVGTMKQPFGWMLLAVLPGCLLIWGLLGDLRGPRAAAAVAEPVASPPLEADPGLAEREAQLAVEVEGLRAQLAAQQRQLAAVLERVEQKPPASPEPPKPVGHVLFMPTETGYATIQREGPPPGVGTKLVDRTTGVQYVVAQLGSSPFPSDQRACAYLQRAV